MFAASQNLLDGVFKLDPVTSVDLQQTTSVDEAAAQYHGTRDPIQLAKAACKEDTDHMFECAYPVAPNAATE